MSLSLPQKLYRRCQDVLGECKEFDSHNTLQNVFAVAELAPFKQRLPTAESQQQRVNGTIAYLCACSLSDGRAVLPIFLRQVQGNYSGDALYNQLDTLAADIESHIATLHPELDELEQDLSVSSPPPPSSKKTIMTTFENRTGERGTIRRCLERGEYVQVLAPAGLGKTYLLQQIQREVNVEGMLTIWMDFIGKHRHCGADKFALLHEIHRQLTDSDDKNIFHENEENVFRIIGQHLAQRSRKLVLFFDNADRVSWRMLEWIRSTLLKRLSDFQQIGVVASGQHKIREWQGYAVRACLEFPQKPGILSCMGRII